MKVDLNELIKITKPLTVLYVEDDKDVKETFLEFLDILFDNILKANDGVEGLQIFKENKVDLAIVDIRLPTMDGLELIKKIKQIDPDIKIIIISAYYEEIYKEQAHSLGVKEYIEKPVQMDKFLQSLSNVL